MFKNVIGSFDAETLKIRLKEHPNSAQKLDVLIKKGLFNQTRHNTKYVTEIQLLKQFKAASRSCVEVMTHFAANPADV